MLKLRATMKLFCVKQEKRRESILKEARDIRDKLISEAKERQEKKLKKLSRKQERGSKAKSVKHFQKFMSR